MFVPKWLLFLLFLISIGSTVLLLIVLSSKPTPMTNKPEPTSVVTVSSTPHSPTGSPVASPSASALPAAADWQKFKNTDLSLSLDYPTSWSNKVDGSTVRISDNKKLVESSPSAVPKDSVVVSINRSKKPKSSYTLADYKKNADLTIKSENSTKIADYSAYDWIYTDSDDKQHRTIVFLTRNYIYTISIEPQDTSLKAVVDEILKSIEII